MKKEKKGKIFNSGRYSIQTSQVFTVNKNERRKETMSNRMRRLDNEGKEGEVKARSKNVGIWDMGKARGVTVCVLTAFQFGIYTPSRLLPETIRLNRQLFVENHGESEKKVYFRHNMCEKYNLQFKFT